jgi:hypothetical protein
MSIRKSWVYVLAGILTLSLLAPAHAKPPKGNSCGCTDCCCDPPGP